MRPLWYLMKIQLHSYSFLEKGANTIFSASQSLDYIDFSDPRNGHLNLGAGSKSSIEAGFRRVTVYIYCFQENEVGKNLTSISKTEWCDYRILCSKHFT